MDTCCHGVDLFAAFDHVLDVYALSNVNYRFSDVTYLMFNSSQPNLFMQLYFITRDRVI